MLFTMSEVHRITLLKIYLTTYTREVESSGYETHQESALKTQ